MFLVQEQVFEVDGKVEGGFEGVAVGAGGGVPAGGPDTCYPGA